MQEMLIKQYPQALGFHQWSCAQEDEQSCKEDDEQPRAICPTRKANSAIIVFRTAREAPSVEKQRKIKQMLADRRFQT